MVSLNGRVYFTISKKNLKMKIFSLSFRRKVECEIYQNQGSFGLGDLKKNDEKNLIFARDKLGIIHILHLVKKGELKNSMLVDLKFGVKNFLFCYEILFGNFILLGFEKIKNHMLKIAIVEFDLKEKNYKILKIFEALERNESPKNFNLKFSEKTSILLISYYFHSEDKTIFQILKFGKNFLIDIHGEIEMENSFISLNLIERRKGGCLISAFGGGNEVATLRFNFKGEFYHSLEPESIGLIGECCEPILIDNWVIGVGPEGDLFKLKYCF